MVFGPQETMSLITEYSFDERLTLNTAIYKVSDI